MREASLGFREYWEFRCTTHPPGWARAELVAGLFLPPLLLLLWPVHVCLTSVSPDEVVPVCLAGLIIGYLMLPRLPVLWLANDAYQIRRFSRGPGLLEVRLGGKALDLEGARVWYETPRLLVMRGRVYVPMPKRLWNEAELQELREHLDETIGPPLSVARSGPALRLTFSLRLSEYFDFLTSTNPPAHLDYLAYRVWGPFWIGLLLLLAAPVLSLREFPTLVVTHCALGGLFLLAVAAYHNHRSGFARKLLLTRRRRSYWLGTDRFYFCLGWAADDPKSWSQLHAWHETRHSILFHYGPALERKQVYHIIPKRSMNSNQLDGLRALLNLRCSCTPVPYGVEG